MSFNPSMPPFYANVPAIGLPFGTVIAPGGRIAAYVRATAKNDDPPFIQENRVASINEACKRVRSGRPDVIVVLDGHTETHSVTGAIWPNLKAGTVIIGCGRPGASNAPRVTLAHTGASIALNVADVQIIGLDIRSSTAALTAALAITAAGCGLFGSRLLFTGALGANPLIALTGAADFLMDDVDVIGDSTDPLLEITGAATTNFKITRVNFRQTQATAGGNYVAVADTAGISGLVGYCTGKTATPLTTAGTGFDLDAANIIANVLNVENYCTDNVATAGVIATGAAANPT